jgi:hypothetical protein
MDGLLDSPYVIITALHPVPIPYISQISLTPLYNMLYPMPPLLTVAIRASSARPNSTANSKPQTSVLSTAFQKISPVSHFCKAPPCIPLPHFHTPHPTPMPSHPRSSYARFHPIYRHLLSISISTPRLLLKKKKFHMHICSFIYPPRLVPTLL